MARPFRYTFILLLAALATSLAAVGGWRYARASAPVSGPIILISIDTLRADRLPAYGYTAVRTPAIDALAREGVVFERAYSHAPQTLPAHTSLLSGRLPVRTGVRGSAGFVVADSERLLAEMLRDRGYATAGIVSSYLLRRSTGIAQGFSFFDDELPRNSGTAFDGLKRDGAKSAEVAENWLATAGTERAFLFLHLDEPHRPYAARPRFSEYDGYDAAVAHADEIVGGLVDFLKASQLYDQSTLILVSDHGEGLGDHGEEGHGLFVYEEAVRVPLIIKPAAGRGQGRRVADVVQHVDLVPTILDLANAPVPDNLHGRSLRRLLDGGGALDEPRVYSESLYGRQHFGWSELATLTDGRYRYIKAPREELYDLERDPAQRDNLAETQPATAAAMRLELERIVASASPVAMPLVWPEDRERLHALGYIGMGGSPGGPTADPKDKVRIVEAFRVAHESATARQWANAIDALSALTETPERLEAWRQIGMLAAAAGRLEQSLDAYRRVLASQPMDVAAQLGAAAALLRLRHLDDARAYAVRAAQLAAALPGGARFRAAGHDLLSRVALARRDFATARAEATLAEQIEPDQPYGAYIEGRIRFEQGRMSEAAPLFAQAVNALDDSRGRPVQDLHFHHAEALARLGRAGEAETAYLRELDAFPQNVRARGGLAALHFAAGRFEAADQALQDLIRLVPTHESYSLAARLWTSFGNTRQAAAARAEARRSLAPPAPAVSSAAQQ